MDISEKKIKFIKMTIITGVTFGIVYNKVLNIYLRNLIFFTSLNSLKVAHTFINL